MILITGASGNVGREVLKQVAGRGVQVRAAFQSVSKAAAVSRGRARYRRGARGEGAGASPQPPPAAGECSSAKWLPPKAGWNSPTPFPAAANRCALSINPLTHRSS